MLLKHHDDYTTFFIGKDAKDNFDVIDLGKGSDYWIHAENEASCHVVVKFDENVEYTKKQKNLIIKQGALYCKLNTNKLKTKSKVSFMYTLLANVSKTSILGQVRVSSYKIATV